MSTAEILAGVGMAFGGLVWLIRLEGRVDKNEALHNELKEHVEYIRERIDDALSRK